MYRSLQLVLMIILFVATAILYFLHFTHQKIVCVDSAKLVNNYQGMIDARRSFQQKSNVWKSNIDTLALEVQKSIKDYEKESVAMSAKEKELSQELIRTKQKQLADYQRAMNDKAAQEDNQMTRQVLEQVNAYIEKYGKKNGYKVIFAATEYGNIAYAEEGMDITDRILEGLNNEYAGQ